MSIPPSIPEPPDFEAIAGWIGGLGLVFATLIGSIWLAIKRVSRLAEAMPEERPTRIVTADTVAMDRLAGTFEGVNLTIAETNGLLRKLLEQGGEILLRAEEAREAAAEAREEAEINQMIKDQLAEALAQLPQKKKRAPPRARRRPATLPKD